MSDSGGGSGVGGDGDSGQPICAATYAGCLGKRQDCLPDGSQGEIYNGVGQERLGAVDSGASYEGCDGLHMACWCDGAGRDSLVS
jgi:hypothetical protein